MDYELALELKNAGFKIRKSCFCDDESCIHMIFPTLSELIEACGKYVNLFQLEDGWGAHWSKESMGGTFEFKASGSTIEEAVARLWLELNKK